MASSSLKTLVAVLVILLSTTSSLTAFPKKPRLAVKLVHRDAIRSPDQNIAPHEQAKREFESSAARFAYLNEEKHDYKAGIVPSKLGSYFMANISVGDPPVPQLLLIDTGSSLTWFQCLPCIKCYDQLLPIFDPSKSKTYASLPCPLYPFCQTCNSSDACSYRQGYVDKTSSSGVFAREKLTFETSDEGIIDISKVLIGCGHENVNIERQHSGILGLAPNPNLSLVYNFNSTFSYCLGNINDPSYQYNSLILGDGAIVEGRPSPLDLYKEYYYVSLESISVGKKLLKINPDALKRSTDTGVGGIIIDSGTSFTFLPREAFLPLLDELQPLLSRTFTPILVASNTLCYKGNVGDIPRPFPLVSLRFAGGAELVLGVDSLFSQYGSGFFGAFCMTVAESTPELQDARLAGIIGIKSQQNYNIAYDLAKKTISFLRIDCELLE